MNKTGVEVTSVIIALEAEESWAHGQPKLHSKTLSQQITATKKDVIKQCYKPIELSITEHMDHLRPGNSRWEVSNCFFPHIANDIDYYLVSCIRSTVKLLRLMRVLIKLCSMVDFECHWSNFQIADRETQELNQLFWWGGRAYKNMN